MKKSVIIILILCDAILGLSQGINSKGFLTGTPNTVLITSADTTQLFSKRDTSAFANSIRNSTPLADMGNCVTVSANYTVLANDYIIAVANQATPVTITLPTASSSTKREIVIKRQYTAGIAANTGSITISCTPTTTLQAGNIKRLDGSFGITRTLEAVGNYGSSVRLYSNGFEWIGL